MTINCNDRDRIFEDGTPLEWAALEAHAKTCDSCAEEIRAWKSLSIAAQEMRDYQESPSLWPRIQQRLSAEAQKKTQREQRWGWLTGWKNISLGWQTAAAGALVLLLTVSAGWFYFHPRTEKTNTALLKSKALKEVERTELAYTQAIDKLAQDAKPQLDHPATPLLSSYREKLLTLDSAIDELRDQAGRNPSNAHLRYQLLAMYQEKQRTLEEVLEEKR